MNVDWQVVKERALEAFSKLSQLLVFLAACFYFLGCVVSAKPMGPKGYVDFTYYVFHYSNASHHPAPKAVAKAR